MKKILFGLFLILTFTKTQAQEGMFDGKWIYDHWTIPDYATYSKPLAFYTLYRCDEVLYGNYEYQFKLFPTDSLSVSANKVQGLKSKTDSYGYALSASTYTKTESDGRFKPLSYQPTYASLPDKPAIPTNTNQLINGAGYLTSYTETDPTVPAYSKTLSAFSVIKTSTDPLYKNISYTPTSLEITNALGFSPLSSTGNGSGLTGLLKSQVGLTNVDNTSDASKPVSTATQTALNNKQNSVALTTTGTGAATFNTTTGALNIPTPAIIITDYTNTATVAGGAGNAVFYITSDKTSTGTALYTNVNFVLPIVNDSNANYTYGWSYDPTTKALTVNVKTNVSTNALLNVLGGLVPVLSPPSNVANGVNVSLLVKGS